MLALGSASPFLNMTYTAFVTDVSQQRGCDFHSQRILQSLFCFVSDVAAGGSLQYHLQVGGDRYPSHVYRQ